MEEDQILQVVKGLLEMVGVAGMDHLLPSDLSTGMKRSVAIARALSAQPGAILYDEPTTMVDPLMGQLLGDLIQRSESMQLHLTSIIVTHDMRFAAKLADRVVFLHEGHARFFGTMDEMRHSSDELLREFLELDELVLPVYKVVAHNILVRLLRLCCVDVIGRVGLVDAGHPRLNAEGRVALSMSRPLDVDWGKNGDAGFFAANSRSRAAAAARPGGCRPL